jgi:hypothetical protein
MSAEDFDSGRGEIGPKAGDIKLFATSSRHTATAPLHS